MVTIVTDVRLREGAQETWDTVMRERMTRAQAQPGWVAGQLLRTEDRPTQRIIVGTWQSRGDWEKWHEDPEFAETRHQLAELVSDEQHAWHDVVVDMRQATKAALRPRRNADKRTAARKTE